MSLAKLSLLAASLTLATATAAHAYPISSVLVFGDSLSDNGNLYKATFGTAPAAPYYMGRFSNGPVAVEQLAANLKVPLYDYAFGGATTGVGNYADGGTQTTPGTGVLPGVTPPLPGIQGELTLAASQLNPSFLSSSLVIVFGGANDFFSFGSPVTAATNIDTIVSTLISDGAQHILVPGLPDLGLTPEFYGNPVATAYSNAFNTLVQANLPKGATYFDTNGLIKSITGNPAAYGLTNVTQPCFNSTVTPTTLCSNPGQYLFFDGVHPTTATAAILASQFAAVSGVTPEPSSFILIGSGAAWLTALTRRHRRTRTT